MINDLDMKMIDNIVDVKKIFKKSFSSCKLNLKKWCRKDQAGFIERFGSDLETVLKIYKFEHAFYSLNKSQLSKKPLYYIEIIIRIYDEEDTYIMEYQVFFDDKLEIFNESFRRWLYKCSIK